MASNFGNRLYKPCYNNSIFKALLCRCALQAALKFRCDCPEENGRNGVLTASSWAKSIAIGFEFGFPFGFQGHFYQCLLTALHHGTNLSLTFFCFSWLCSP